MTETVYFSSGGNIKDGFNAVQFYLSDLISQFRITANAYNLDGNIGYKSKLF